MFFVVYDREMMIGWEDVWGKIWGWCLEGLNS